MRESSIHAYLGQIPVIGRFTDSDIDSKPKKSPPIPSVASRAQDLQNAFKHVHSPRNLCNLKVLTEKDAVKLHPR